jgi:hypothetical protein
MPSSGSARQFSRLMPQNRNESQFMTDQNNIERLGTLVFDVIGELFHRGEETLDPDSPEAIELRKAAYAAVGVKGVDPLTVAGRELAYRVMEHLQGMRDFQSVKAASRFYEQARITRTADKIGN